MPVYRIPSPFQDKLILTPAGNVVILSEEDPPEFPPVLVNTPMNHTTDPRMTFSNATPTRAMYNGPAAPWPASLTSCTWECWVKPTSRLPYSQKALGTKSDTVGFHLNSTGNLAFQYHSGVTGDGVYDGDPTIVWGPWQHYAASINMSNLEWKLYKNGVLVGTDSHPLPAFGLPETISLAFGDYYLDANSRFAGEFKDLRVWDVVRTPAEILAAKDIFIADNTEHLLFNYKCNEGVGTALHNSGTYGAHNLDIVGTGTWA
jgi:hypothetical protein